jgi:hypothetical protein
MGKRGIWVSETQTPILAIEALFYENLLTNLRKLGSVSRLPISHVRSNYIIHHKSRSLEL